MEKIVKEVLKETLARLKNLLTLDAGCRLAHFSAERGFYVSWIKNGEYMCQPLNLVLALLHSITAHLSHLHASGLSAPI